jgi:hypothetical protein
MKLLTIKEFTALHNAAKGDKSKPPYPVQDKFSIEKTKTIKERVTETRTHANGVPYLETIEQAVTKRVFDTNGFTKLAVAYLRWLGFEAKRISSEGKWRKGIGYIPSENKGIADIMAIKEGKVYFIEIKQPREAQLDSQKKFEGWATKAGAPYVIVRGWEDLQVKVSQITSL